MNTLAKHVAAQGRYGDTELIHVSKDELSLLHGLGSLMNKPLTINPHTGYPEAFKWSSLIPAVVGIGGSLLSGGTLSPLMLGMISGAATTAVTGSWQKGLLSGVAGGMMGGLGQGLAAMGAPAAEAAAMAPVAQGAAGAGMAAGETGAMDMGLGALSGGMANTAATAAPIAQGAAGAGMSAGQTGAMDMGIGQAVASAPTAGGFSGQTFANNVMNPDAWKAQFGGQNLYSRTMPGIMAANVIGQDAMTPEPGNMPGQKRNERARQFALPEKIASRNYNAPTDPYYAMKGGEHNYFSPTSYNFARGGTVGLGGLGRKKYQSPDEKAVKILRSRYRSKGQAVSDMGVQGSAVNKLGIQDPNHPLLDAAFGYTKNEGKQKGGMVPAYAAGGVIGDGMSDSVPAMVDGQQPAKLSTDEYVFPADAVSGLGNGSSSAGAAQLDDMVARIRKARTGSAQQAPQIDPRTVMPR